MLAWEWPLGFLAGTAIHRSIEARLVALPMCALVAALIYQATNPAIYYVIGMGVYFWAYSEGEVCSILSYPIICTVVRRQYTNKQQVVVAVPWSLPQRGNNSGKV